MNPSFSPQRAIAEELNQRFGADSPSESTPLLTDPFEPSPIPNVDAPHRVWDYLSIALIVILILLTIGLLIWFCTNRNVQSQVTHIQILYKNRSTDDIYMESSQAPSYLTLENDTGIARNLSVKTLVVSLESIEEKNEKV